MKVKVAMHIFYTEKLSKAAKPVILCDFIHGCWLWPNLLRLLTVAVAKRTMQVTDMKMPLSSSDMEAIALRPIRS